MYLKNLIATVEKQKAKGKQKEKNSPAGLNVKAVQAACTQCVCGLTPSV